MHDTQVPVHALSQHTPSAQKPEAHTLVPVQGWPLARLQDPVPSQARSAAQAPASIVPGAADAQVPSLPATAHDWHTPVHAPTSQHTPSTQNPLAHHEVDATVHPSPLPRFLTLYSQVSLPVSRTITPRTLSKTMWASEPGSGIVAVVRMHKVLVRVSISQVWPLDTTT
jgi:hypothetical protein